MDFEYVRGVWKVCNILKGLILYMIHITNRLSVSIAIAMIRLNSHLSGGGSNVILAEKHLGGCDVSYQTGKSPHLCV